MESELVSGFFTEHSAVIFVFFFLAEYASIILICVLMSILFLGGYTHPFELLVKSYDNPLIEGFIYGAVLCLKACALVFTFIWVRASLPRIRFDGLIQFCWTVLLPLVFAFIFLIPCILVSFDVTPFNLLIPTVLVRNSTEGFENNKPLSITDEEFNEWLVGFTDGSPTQHKFIRQYSKKASAEQSLVVWGTHLQSTVGE